MDKKKEKAATTVTQVNKRFGAGTVVCVEESSIQTAISVIPTGFAALDAALGVGGYPRGRIVELLGPEGGGKTTLALHAIAEAQRAGGVAAFIDAEHAFDPSYARALGVNTAALLFAQPDSGEQALEIAETLTRSGAVDLVVVDSVAALTPQAEIDGDDSFGKHVRLMTQALRKLTPVAHRTDTVVLFTNQLRRKEVGAFGNPESTSGGQALKFYASVRLDVRCNDRRLVRVKVVKNKVAAPFREAEFEIGLMAPKEVANACPECGRNEDENLTGAGRHVSLEWVLSQLAGMCFPEQGQAYEFIKRSARAKVLP